jgi:hypothetical protein
MIAQELYRQSIDQVQKRLKSISALSRTQLDELHFDWEVVYASAIKKSSPGSVERELCLQPRMVV